MPTYSYACTECDNRFDAVQAFTDDALTTCPECSGRLRKLFNSVGVVFKGSGFYRTDSRESAEEFRPTARRQFVESSSSEKSSQLARSRLGKSRRPRVRRRSSSSLEHLDPGRGGRPADRELSTGDRRREPPDAAPLAYVAAWANRSIRLC